MKNKLYGTILIRALNTMHVYNQFIISWYNNVLQNSLLSSKAIWVEKKTCTWGNRRRKGCSLDQTRTKWRWVPIRILRNEAAYWRKYHVKVQRRVVQRLLREIDPEWSNEHRSHRPKRREYNNPSLSFCWHADGYDKVLNLVDSQFMGGFGRRVLYGW
jgi:hypothetical protein